MQEQAIAAELADPTAGMATPHDENTALPAPTALGADATPPEPALNRDATTAGGPAPRNTAAAPVKRPPTNAELHAIRQVRPITAEDLGPGPFATGFTLEEELEFQNYIPEPLEVSEEEARREARRQADEARKYAEELIAEFGEPTAEERARAAKYWDDVFNRRQPEGF